MRKLMESDGNSCNTPIYHVAYISCPTDEYSNFVRDVKNLIDSNKLPVVSYCLDVGVPDADSIVVLASEAQAHQITASVFGLIDHFAAKHPDYDLEPKESWCHFGSHDDILDDYREDLEFAQVRYLNTEWLNANDPMDSLGLKDVPI